VDKELVREQLKQIQNLESWLSSEFSALISFTEKNVLTKLREQFSKIFNDWFSILVSDSLSVRLNEDFSPIISQQDFELDYSYLSGGERTAVALAYRLALNQVINSLLSKIKTRDIVILDEPTDGFSEAQLDKMRDVLQQLKVKQLILVSHEQKIEGFVDKVIRFKKEAGESRIEKDL
jgi:exonuclease SbcC